MSRKQSPERHTVYIDRRRQDKEHTTFIHAQRSAKRQAIARFGGAL